MRVWPSSLTAWDICHSIYAQCILKLNVFDERRDKPTFLNSKNAIVKNGGQTDAPLFVFPIYETNTEFSFFAKVLAPFTPLQVCYCACSLEVLFRVLSCQYATSPPFIATVAAAAATVS